jgi:hypothetical protein
MERQKKTWTTPELVVLVRSTPGEAVLQNCKMDWNPVGPQDGAPACDVDLCGACEVYVTT